MIINIQKSNNNKKNNMQKNTSYYSRLAKNKSRFLKITGLSIEKFDFLYEEIAPLVEQAEFKRKYNSKRQRKIGGGAQYTLHLKDRLLMTLIYYRVYTTQDFLGFVFGLNRSNVCRAFKLISYALPKVFKIPERRIKVKEDEIIELFIDGTEQPINRPKNKSDRRKYYSGKKKRHTAKVQVIVSVNDKGKRKIESISKSHEGKKHDKKIHDETKTILPYGIDVFTDTGYLGTGHIMPKKKPKGKELSEEEKQNNKKIASKRCVNEHVIGFIKRYRIVRDQFRNNRKDHGLIFKNAAGLAGMMLC